MKLEKLKDRPLNEAERLLKQAYLTGPSALWEKPMSYSEYEQYDREGMITQIPTSHFFRDKTVEFRGVTIDDIKSSNQAMISVHQRYTYPVLHNHNYVEIVYVAAGDCVNLFENTSFAMKTGDVCILAPNSLHALSCTDDGSCIINMMVNRRFFDKRFLSLLRGGELLIQYLEGILFEREISPYILFPTGQDPWLQELARRMLTENTTRAYSYEYSIALLIGQFLLQLMREYETVAIVPSKSGNTQNDLIVGVLSYLNVHYNQATLAAMAQYFGYSPAYLSRMIREQTGKTFNTIISQIQMDRAVQMLSGGEKSLTEIALEVGCFDTSHFNKKFKAVYGISPRQFLEQKKT